ncbi:hypothetical protein [Clostridium acetobutylicum]|uniref:Uncharacterized protein n=2 Tax=Clostridiaceae TaxID=31979 RepID=Q97JS4_CLOAB|nr:hypothetical protein [Clostridium acetobutylicum]PSM04863.1 hypothetical protein C7T89_16050 [Clostridium sp. NJ4]AAK79171.1 Hypothetical protein CA_C1199 [Clostridium acetobutylicum ATCC 824]AEI31703.1 hypothetical protein SMB_G1219 [Clostridium acetobutylicum DSM 1731]AWV81578.1 hypothetical protein DK921_16055 [Clostridium acetobutylicum]MBC2393217.1 hypothetical protein [Clostridium acetobutylicum]
MSNINAMLKLIDGITFLPDKDDFSKEKIQSTFKKKIHPRQVISFLEEIPISIYKVKFRYTTFRGNRREKEMYFLIKTYSPEEDMQKYLDKYINDFNKKFPNRQLSNVQILDSCCKGLVTL